MIFVRLKIEYFFSVFGILLFCSPIIHRKQLYSYLWMRFFVSYSLISKDFNCQLSIVNMLVLCWCYVDLMLVLCRALFNRSFLQLET